MIRTIVLCGLAMAGLSSGAACADAQADVRQAFEKVLSEGGFRGHVSGQIFGPGTPAVSGQIDALFPDRIHMQDQTLEFIVTTGGAWISALGYWTPVDRSLLPVTAFDMASMRSAIASISNVRDEGRAKSASCSNLRVYAFEASGQLPGTTANGKLRLWVCQRDGRPSRIQASDASGQQMIIDFDWSRRPRVEAPGN
ncbi:hypothetical protein [Dokdonella sp.]|uniref:hypothetical protein n=1 Tax=Dokdonella sp. TaxID=2291710 RepID=UPI003C6200A1